MNLNVSEWKPFLVGRIFTVKYGVNLELDSLNEASETGSVNFVSRCISNNGVSAKVEPISELEPQAAGIISVAGGGSSVLSTYVQEEPFYSGRDLYLLIPKIELSKEAKMFITTIIEKNKYRYSFGRQANKTLPFLEILLPIKYSGANPAIDTNYEYSDEGYIPDWQFMEDYIKSLHYKPLTTTQINTTSNNLNVSEWKRFCLGRLFEIKKGKRLTAEDQTDGDNIYIGAIDSNNGVANKIGQSPIHEGNTISLSYNGSVGEAFYQPEPYWATDDVNALYSKYEGFNKYIGLFFVAVIRKEKYRFNYGRKWTLENMKETEICLPVKKNGNNAPIIDGTCIFSEQGYVPDWDYMENYIKNLPYGDRI